ncbi:MAG: class I SAM-dependent methyltransferase [Betaproteobacteria bacterium]
MSERRDHYSYTLYADPATARTFDDRRFGGPIGALVAESQARVLLEFVGAVRGRRVLDVGTGTGRAALLLAREGGEVTGIDASAEMLAVARARAAAEQVAVAFDVGDAHALPFADRAFDAAVSLRVLMHTPRWRSCLGELCRVADQRVVFDYPSARSAAALQALARRIVHALGARTEPYRVLTGGAIARELGRHGFRIRAVHRQFVVPIAIHKAIGSRRFTEKTERLLARAGLLRLLGSPVTVMAERCASS